LHFGNLGHFGVGRSGDVVQVAAVGGGLLGSRLQQAGLQREQFLAPSPTAWPGGFGAIQATVATGSTSLTPRKPVGGSTGFDVTGAPSIPSGQHVYLLKLRGRGRCSPPRLKALQHDSSIGSLEV
jgi:hypothetical protein